MQAFEKGDAHEINSRNIDEFLNHLNSTSDEMIAMTNNKITAEELYETLKTSQKLEANNSVKL